MEPGGGGCQRVINGTLLHCCIGFEMTAGEARCPAMLLPSFTVPVRVIPSNRDVNGLEHLFHRLVAPLAVFIDMFCDDLGLHDIFPGFF